MKKRMMSLLIVLCLLVGMVPFSALALEDAEPNDTIPKAQEFTICDTINGSISEPKGVDWYQFTIEEAGRISLKVSSFMQWYTVSLFDADGNSFWVHDTLEWDATAGMRTDTYTSDLMAGTYYIRITGDQYIDMNCDHVTGDYIIKTDFVSANATETEDNNNFSKSNDLSPFGSVNGHIALNDACDFYRIELPASGEFFLDLTAYMQFAAIVLYNANGDTLWNTHRNTWDASSGMQHLTYSAHLTEGVYYVRISGEYYLNDPGWGLATGAYTLSVDYINANANEIEPNDTAAAAQWVVPNKQINGQIAMNDTMDFFQFTLAKDMELTLDFTSYMQWYAIQLYNEANDRVWYDDSNKWDANSKTRHDLHKIQLTAGTYTMSVTGDESVTYDKAHVTGNYSFMLKSENPFSDVPVDAFFYDPVLWAVEQGITSGTSGTTFSPNDSCMRAHVVTFLWRAAGSPSPESTVNPFEDVKPEDFYYKAVLWAVENGITTGTDATHFSPFGICNRAQVVTFLHRAFGSPDASASDNPFTDVPTDTWYAAPVLWAVENGITNGLSATEFGPDTPCNRAQVVTFLYRAYN